MTSKLALRTLGAIALPGALLGVVAPTASAVEIDAPLSNHEISGNETVDKVTEHAPEAPDTNDFLSMDDIEI